MNVKPVLLVGDTAADSRLALMSALGVVRLMSAKSVRKSMTSWYCGCTTVDAFGCSGGKQCGT